MLVGENLTMDAEWVGIAGVAGTLVGTLGTSWIGSRNLKTQLAAQQSEADRQRRYDSVKERRESRQKAYEEFLRVAHVLEDLFDELPGWESLRPVFAELHERRTTVVVVGPEQVSHRADAVVGAFTAALFRHGREGEAGADSSDTSGEIQRFAAAARRALEDDGSDPPPPMTTATPRS
jgi:hypothetical protein